MELARKLAWTSVASSVLLFAAAIVCNATGVQVHQGTADEVNSHAAATWVLGTFGVVFLLHAFVLFSWANDQLWTTRRRRDGSR